MPVHSVTVVFGNLSKEFITVITNNFYFRCVFVCTALCFVF